MITSVSPRLNMLCIKRVTRRSVNNAVHSVICEGRYFTHSWQTLAWPHHFNKRWGRVCV